VEDFPVAAADSIRFIVRPIDRDDLPNRIRLTWYQPDGIPSIGDSWRFHVRLKRPRGYLNPGGFDFEGWLFRHRIGATGYVAGDARSYPIHGESRGIVATARKRFVTRVTDSLPEDDASAVLMAIGVGARHGIDRAQWDLYARTGTSHLMAISGLHIGLAASCAYLLSLGLLAPFCRRRNLRDVATGGAVLTAVVYAGLSGLAVPAMRALMMAIVAGAMLLLRRRVGPELVLAVPCAVVFLTNPVAILSPGFKLSFAAVAILIFVAWQHCRFAQADRWPVAGRALTGLGRLTQLQLALMTGLFPLTILIFGRFAMIAPAINLIVLPIFNFITVPLTLAGAILDGPLDVIGMVLLTWAHASIRAILWLVAIAGDSELASQRTGQLDPIFTVVAFIPLAFVLLPPGWPGRKLAFVAIVAVLTYRPPPPPSSCLDYHVLDVGQGLAVVLQTSHHALLFDTGPSFLNGSGTADLVVLPFLRRLGIDRLDKLIISHGDLDHAGGARTITAGVSVNEVLVGEVLPDLDRFQRQCVAGDKWHWDAVAFSILHPRKNTTWERNNASCVLLIEVGHFSLLLTGDIESPPERLLVHRKSISASDVVIVPHHGSLTSSSKPFVDLTGPALAIVSAGFQNRWRFPRPEIVARWEASGAEVLNTATMGAISQRVCADRKPEPVRLQRYAAQKYWHQVPPGRP
jgi:competence protein ComEC